jgi:hypothetical protein
MTVGDVNRAIKNHLRRSLRMAVIADAEGGAAFVDALAERAFADRRDADETRGARRDGEIAVEPLRRTRRCNRPRRGHVRA